MTNQNFLLILLKALDDEGSRPESIYGILLVKLITEISMSSECPGFKEWLNLKFKTLSEVKAHEAECYKCKLLALLVATEQNSTSEDRLEMARTHIKNELKK